MPNLFALKGHIYISFAIPRYKKGNYNWGDDINFIFGEKLSGKKVIPYRYSLFKHQNYIVIGSVIQWYCNSKAIIWGAGLLHEVSSLPKPKKILAVRGPLTRNCLLKCGINCPDIYGDPALLFPLLYHPKYKKKYKIGIIFHFTERNMIDIKTPRNMDKNEVLFIDISQYGIWTNFIDQILSCETILSSSLHGIIISEAYNIPNLWTCFQQNSVQGTYFKYEDFYLSVKKTNTQPFDYNELQKQNDLLSYISNNWVKPLIDINSLVDSCPFDIHKFLEKSESNNSLMR